MAAFRTIVDVTHAENKIGYGDPTLWAGSCFAENIGGKMKRLKFPTEVNPFGVTYNPVSVENSLRILMEERMFTKEDLNYHNGKWFSFYHHTLFSSTDPGECLKKINSSVRNASAFLKKAKYLFITFGTARVYKVRETGIIASNCHKLPENRFKRYLLPVEETVQRWGKLLEELRSYNPGINVVFTVSPVRHWKDGATGNQVSKSVLILAVWKLTELFEFVNSFPAYEILMDDLRDYRFYEKDMLHVNNQAVEYVWEKFSNAYIDHNAHPVMREVEKIKQAAGHKPFDPGSEEYMGFLEQLEKQIQELNKKYPGMDFSGELNTIAERRNRNL